LDAQFNNCIRIETKELIIHIQVDDDELRKSWLKSLSDQTQLLTKQKEEEMRLSISSNSLENLNTSSVDVITRLSLGEPIGSDEADLNPFISQFIQMINAINVNDHRQESISVLRERKKRNRSKLKLPANFDITASNTETLDAAAIQIMPPIDNIPASPNGKPNSDYRDQLIRLNSDFSKFKDFTLLSSLAHLTCIGHTIMEKVSIQVNTQLLYNMSGGVGILKQGYLLKAGPNPHHPWKKRYCVLTETSEFRYIAVIGQAPKGLFNVENTWVSRCIGDIYSFNIETAERTYQFEAENYRILKQWLTALSEAGAHVKFDENDGIVFTGYLLKERNFNSPYRKRYFTLMESNELKYYNKKGGSLKGTIPLDDSYVTIVTGQPEVYHFKIYTPEHTHNLQAESEENLNLWIDILLKYGSKLRRETDPKPLFTRRIEKYYLKTTEEVLLERQEKLQEYIVNEDQLRGRLQKNKDQHRLSMLNRSSRSFRSGGAAISSNSNMINDLLPDSSKKKNQFIYLGKLQPGQMPPPPPRTASDANLSMWLPIPDVDVQYAKVKQVIEENDEDSEPLTLEPSTWPQTPQDVESTPPQTPQELQPEDTPHTPQEDIEIIVAPQCTQTPQEDVKSIVISQEEMQVIESKVTDIATVQEIKPIPTNDLTEEPMVLEKDLSQKEVRFYEPESVTSQAEESTYNVSNAKDVNTVVPYRYTVPTYNNPAIVIDNGSGMIKSGLSHQDYPSHVFNNMIGRVKQYAAKGIGGFVGEGKLYFGDGAASLRGILQLSYPVERGTIKNFDDCEMMIQYIQDGLRLESFNEHAVIMTESPDNNRKVRERTTQMMFETFDNEYLCLAKPSVLSLFAYGYTTGLVLDSGDGITHSVPIYEGFTLHHAVNRLELAGKDLTQYMSNLLNENGMITNLLKSGSAAFEIIRCMKEDLCYTSATPYETSYNNREKSSFYELPDGNHVQVSEEVKMKTPELLFNPTVLGGRYDESPGIAELCKKSICACDTDLGKAMSTYTFVTGGNTKFRGLTERLQTEVQELLPTSNRIKVTGSKDQQFLSWIGGSILSKSSRFLVENVMTRDEYEERGPDFSHIKFM